MSFFDNIFSNVKKFISSDDNTESYTNWIIRLEKKMLIIQDQIHSSLMNQPEIKNVFNDKLQLLNSTLQNVLPLLSEVNFKYRRMESQGDVRIGLIRDLLMKFVSRLIIVLDKVEGTRYMHNFLAVIYQCLIRPEFNLEYLKLNDESCVDSYSRFNDLIVRIQLQVERRLCNTTPAFVNNDLLNFKTCEIYAKLLSLSFLRLKYVRNLIEEALYFNEDVSCDLTDYFPHLDNVPNGEEILYNTNPDYSMTYTEDFEEDFISNYPILDKWYHFEDIVRRDNSDKLNDSNDDRWLEWFQPNSLLVALFTHELIDQIYSITGGNFKWKYMSTYNLLLKHYFFMLLTNEEIYRSLTLATKSFTLTNPRILNYFIRALFATTEAYHFNAVTTTLLKIKPAFEQLKLHQKTLGDSFDASFFCLGLDVIIGSDFQQVLCRALELLYYSSPLFVGYARKTIYLDFLMKKYFFRLFMHWDATVRSYFIQLLTNTMFRVSPENLLDLEITTEEDYALSIEYSIDIKISSVLEGYIQLVIDSLEGEYQLDLDFDVSVGIYAPLALEEYYFFVSKSKSIDGTLIPLLIREF